jgi:hypothetical protein
MRGLSKWPAAVSRSGRWKVALWLLACAGLVACAPGTGPGDTRRGEAEPSSAQAGEGAVGTAPGAAKASVDHSAMGHGTHGAASTHADASSGSVMSEAELRAMLSGESIAPADALPMSWRRLVSDVKAGRIPMAADGVPEGLDTRTDKASDAGVFQVRLDAPAGGIQLNQMGTWEIVVATPAGEAVRGARIDVIGGMPLHNHGFPTAPRVGAESRPGVYPLQGVRLGMGGWWQVLLAISADGTTDTASFDFVVAP